MKLVRSSNPDRSAWPFQDPRNHLGFDLLAISIHIFRMPVFFVMSEAEGHTRREDQPRRSVRFFDRPSAKLRASLFIECDWLRIR
jgi:hypothetical protein